MSWVMEEDWIFKNVIFLISFTSMLIGWAHEKKCMCGTIAYSYASLVDFLFTIIIIPEQSTMS